MITDVASGKYGQSKNKAGFLLAHLPTVDDGSGAADYKIKDADVTALNTETCNNAAVLGNGIGVVGEVYEKGECCKKLHKYLAPS